MTIHDEQTFLENGRRFLTSCSDVNKAVRNLVKAAAATAGSNMGAFYQLDEERGILKPMVVVNLSEEYVKGCGEIPLGQQCCGRAALHKLPWYVADIWNDPLFSPETREAARAAGVRAGFSVPVLTADDKCLGSLSAHFSEPHTPTDYEVKRHFLFARLIAFVLTRKADLADRRMPNRGVKRIDKDDRQHASGND